MSNLFPEPITRLPEVDMPFSNYKAYLSQGENHQIIFIQFNEDIDLPEHSHESQWGIVLEGKIYAGYADMTFFNQRDRYGTK